MSNTISHRQYANVNVRTDIEVKQRAEQVLKEMGLPMSSAINAFLRYIGNERRIPFEFALDSRESDEAYFRSLKKESEAWREGTLPTVSLEEMRTWYGMED